MSNPNANGNSKPKIVNGDYGYVLEDVPHLTDYIPGLPVRFSIPVYNNRTYYMEQCLRTLYVCCG